MMATKVKLACDIPGTGKAGDVLVITEEQANGWVGCGMVGILERNVQEQPKTSSKKAVANGGK